MASSSPRASRRFGALLLAAALAGARAVEAAGSDARVVVGAPDDASGLLKEALVRAQGELAAVGLRAEVEIIDDASRAPRLPSDVYGLLALEQLPGAILIHAWAPRATRPIEARVDLTTPGVTAEVIAVRAVETLRAAMLQFAQTSGGDVPAAVRGFTRFTPEPRETPAPAPAPPAESSRRDRLAPPLAFWAGPTVSLHAGTSPDLGAQLGVLVGPSFGFAAAAFETTLSDLHVQDDPGGADVRRQAVWVQLGARFRLAQAWEITTRAGLGYAAFTIEGEGESGYSGRSAKHGSPALMLGVSTAYWATRSFGLYASVGGRLAFDAPTILIAETPVITLDRPSFVLSLGSNVGVF